MTIQVNINGVIKDVKEINFNNNGTIRNAHTIQINDNGIIKEVFSNYDIIDSIKITTEYLSDKAYGNEYPYPAELIINNDLRQVSIRSKSYYAEQFIIRMKINFYDKLGNKISSKDIPKNMSIEYFGSLQGRNYDGLSSGNHLFSVFGYDLKGNYQSLVSTNDTVYIPYSLKVSSPKIQTFSDLEANNVILYGLVSSENSNVTSILTIDEFAIKNNDVVVKKIVPIFELTK